MRIALIAVAIVSGVAAPALAQTAPPPAAPATETDRSKEIVCRREVETGSLVKSKKTCHTRAQWAYIDDTNQAQTRAMQDDMRTRSGGN